MGVNGVKLLFVQEPPQRSTLTPQKSKNKEPIKGLAPKVGDDPTRIGEQFHALLGRIAITDHIDPKKGFSQRRIRKRRGQNGYIEVLPQRSGKVQHETRLRITFVPNKCRGGNEQSMFDLGFQKL